MDDRELERQATGYLKVRGSGGLTIREMQELLASVDDAYVAIAQAESAATERLVALRAARQWSRRWGPPEMMLPWVNLATTHIGRDRAAPVGPEIPLVVSRVVLRSPGFWEFLGALNPLEVTRKYLNDRHERRKDDEYRSPAEADRLALENALLGLDVLRRYRELEREYDDSAAGGEMLRRYIGGAVRPSLERLGELMDRGLIEGGSALTDEEPLPEDDRGE